MASSRSMSDSAGGEAGGTPPRPTAVDPVEHALESSLALAPWFAGTAAGTLWVAFSGGLDSTVLLHALRGVRGVAAIHIDHGIQAHAAAWSRHCAAVAAEFGIARCYCVPVRVHRVGNLEHNARRLRYAAWQRRLAAGDVLVLAHHADDQAETRLWQLLTGRRPWGMPAQRRLGAGRLARPLLGVRRQALAAYAERWGLRWIEDPTNADLGFDRNYIRHRLLPLIEARFPRAVDHLAQPRPVPQERLEPLPAQTATPPGIEAWLLAAGLPAARRTVAEIRRQSAAAHDRSPRVDVTPGIQAWRQTGAWHLVPRHKEPLADAHAGFPATVGDDLATPDGVLSWRPAERGLPPAMSLTVRRRLGGERIHPDGRGITKTVKALFREQRIPPWQRQAWPLLYNAAADLVAVPGFAIAEAAAVDGGLCPEWTPTSTLTDSG